ncbi:MAG: ABC transporter substrate-binding protein [Asgard group archaeon]|nr:ABC transporter substrate-binding protein [Asgard group archaeon]
MYRLKNHSLQAASWAISDPSKIIGAGPYKLEEYNETDDIIHLTKNPYFADLTAGTDPNFQDVYFEFYSTKEAALSALSSGTIDMIDAEFSPIIDEVKNITNATYRLVVDPGSQEMAYNCQHPLLGTGESCPIPGKESARHIRRAIDYMIPRKEIIDLFFEGLAMPGKTPMPAVSIGFDESLEAREYSIKLAKDEMRAAGYQYVEDTTTILTKTIGINFSLLLMIIELLAFIMVIYMKKSR